MNPKRTHGIKLFLIFSSVICALFAAELTLRIISPSKISNLIVVKDPLFGYLHKKDTSTEYLQGTKYFSIKINHEGLRQHDNVDTDPNTVRILLLGDSYVFGWGVDYKDTFVYQLSQKAQLEYPNKKIQFLNAGHGGWGTQQMLAYLEKKGFDFKPNLIFMVMGPNDVEDNANVPIYGGLQDKVLRNSPRVLDYHGNRSWFANWIPGYEWLLFHSQVLQLIRMPLIESNHFLGMRRNEVRNLWYATTFAKKVNSQPEAFDPTWGFNLTRLLVLKMQEKCNKKGIPLFISNVGNGSYPTTGFFTWAVPVLKKAKVDYVDMFVEMDPKASAPGFPLFLDNDTHYNEIGHGILAEHLWPHLKKRLDPIMEKFPVKKGFLSQNDSE